MSSRFQVDLAGIVNLLSRHLYSGPQVYVRELMQNAVDAVTARTQLDPTAPARIRIDPGVDASGRATLEVADTGIGLTLTEATELLATIGRSSKRDETFGVGRAEFIGQFGIGMLAAFMVADRIEVVTRSAQAGARTVVWEGRSDGTFAVHEVNDDTDIGTRVRLVARHEAEHWVTTDSVLALAEEYGSLLPFDVAVRVPVDGGDPVWRRITAPDLPWRTTYRNGSERDTALVAYCERTFGFTPIGHIDLEVPLAGLSGVAFVLPQAVSPGSGQHRVYMKRMLLGSRIDRILPEWAFFLRAVVDADALSPTASREQLHEDEILMGVRDALSDQLKSWASERLGTPSRFAANVISTHHLALRALALSDTSMLDLVASILPFETTDGPMTLAAAAAPGELLYTTTTEAYRRVAAVARAEGIVVVNAGYVYDADIMERLRSQAGWNVRELETSDLVHVLGTVGLERELDVARPLARARDVLEADDCDAIVRVFSPENIPAMLLRDAEGEHRRDLDRERDATPGLWGGLLDAFASDAPQRTRTLVLNDSSPVVRRLLAAPPGEVFDAGLRSLYLSAVMLAGEGLRSAESSTLVDALGTLLSSALDSTTDSPASEGHES